MGVLLENTKNYSWAAKIDLKNQYLGLKNKDENLHSLAIKWQTCFEFFTFQFE